MSTQARKPEPMTTGELVERLTATRVREKIVYMNCAGQLYPVTHIHETDRLLILSPINPEVGDLPQTDLPS